MECPLPLIVCTICGMHRQSMRRLKRCILLWPHLRKVNLKAESGWSEFSFDIISNELISADSSIMLVRSCNVLDRQDNCCLQKNSRFRDFRQPLTRSLRMLANRRACQLQATSRIAERNLIIHGDYKRIVH
jgi:hypothetical protein